MSITLSQFLDELDRHAERVPLEELRKKMEELEITLDQVSEFVRFGDTTYRRNLMHQGPGYAALILCWRSGQRSPIHDHRESSCGVRVLKGTATETVFERNADGFIFPTQSRELREGQVCGSQDEDIHQMSNIQGCGCDLVTLHVYSPPLMKMRLFSLTDRSVREFSDPVFEMMEGAGI